MFEVPHAGYHHDHAMFLAKVDAVVVAHGTTRMDDAHHAHFMRVFHAVVEREKCVGRKHTAL